MFIAVTFSEVCGRKQLITNEAFDVTDKLDAPTDIMGNTNNLLSGQEKHQCLSVDMAEKGFHNPTWFPGSRSKT